MVMLIHMKHWYFPPSLSALQSYFFFKIIWEKMWQPCLAIFSFWLQDLPVFILIGSHAASSFHPPSPSGFSQGYKYHALHHIWSFPLCVCTVVDMKWTQAGTVYQMSCISFSAFSIVSEILVSESYAFPQIHISLLSMFIFHLHLLETHTCIIVKVCFGLKVLQLFA